MIYVMFGVLVYTLFFSAISFLRFDAFSYSDFDFAIFTHEAWKILHGSTCISIFDNTSIFGNALELISFLTAPIFALCGYNPKSFLFLQSLALGLGAIPIYLIAKDKLSHQLAVCFASSYLLYPPIWYANLYEYNPLVFTTLTLLYAFYFFLKERFLPFMLFIVLTMINRVDLGVVTGMFGVYAFAQRRSWRWVLIPSVLSFLYVVVGLLLIIPTYKNILGYDSNYAQFGHGGFAQVIINIVLHPKLLWDVVVTALNGNFLVQVLAPVLFLPLFGLAEFAIAGLSLIQHLISIRPQEHTIFFHYTATLTPFIYIASIYGAARFFREKAPKRWFCGAVILFSLCSNLLYGPLSGWGTYYTQLIQSDEDHYKKLLIDKIPLDAPVMSSFEFSPMLAGRKAYYSFHYVANGDFRPNVVYPIPKDIEYCLVNFNDLRLRSFFHAQSDVRMRTFLDDFHVVDTLGPIVLFKKGKSPSGFLLYQSLPKSKIAPIFATKIGLLLNKLNVVPIYQQGWNMLELEWTWSIDRPMRETAGMNISIRDDLGQEVVRAERVITNDLYPTRHWTLNEDVLDRERILLPKGFKTGRYRIFVSLFSVDKKMYYSVEGQKDPLIMVGEFNHQ